MADPIEPKKEDKQPETPPTPPVEPKKPETPPVEPKKDETELPAEFKDKSPKEIVEAIKEMSGKVADVEEMKKVIGQWEKLGTIIQSNPALYKAIEEEVKRSVAPKEEIKQDDARVATQGMIINDFEKGYAIDKLEPTKKQELHVKIGNELAEMFDPGGTKSPQQVIQEIPLDKLPRYLEKAYKLATVDDTAERARLQGIIEARQNNEASFGSIPSSNGKSDSISLTPEQRQAAQKMGVSEEQYAKNFKDLQEGK